MQNLHIQRKFMVVFGGLMILITGICVLAIVALSSVNTEATALVERRIPNLSNAMELKTAVANIRAGEYNHILSSTLHALREADADLDVHRKALSAVIAKYSKTLARPETLTNFSEFKARLESYYRDDARVLELSRALRKDEALAVARDAETRFDAVLASADQAVEIQRDLAKEVSNSVSTTESRSRVTLIVALVIGVAGVLGGLIMLTRLIARPLSELSRATGILAAGGKADVPHRDRGDEIGDVAKAVEQFRMAAVDRAGSDARAAAEQQIVTTTLAEGLVLLTEGDLTAEISVEFPRHYAALKTNFNDAVVRLRTMIGSVSESAAGIRTGSSEIAQASDDLARRTEGNAASLEQTSAALVQIDGRLKATASAAGRTVARADQAIATVSGGRTMADEAVQAMERVRESATGIDSVIQGVDKIAFQTRVLAMNAAVEAGRAGDAGRGFAVVADLVSSLAMRAEEEAKRARDQLTVTQTDIVTAVEAVQRVDGALANISGDVGEVHTLLGTMAADNQAQSSAITQISVAVSAMDQSTQQNAAMVEQTSAAARNLTNEVTALADQAALFKVDNGAVRKVRKVAKAAPAKIGAVPYTSPVKALPVSVMAKANGVAHGIESKDWSDF
ncbi:methyl-accepting chemotaxis protein [Sphingobium boeckii]|uniref:Methyl-accepting chemotaxis protein n=1 Tax=Sphingobium boeckii TaxID=1082345 RepID=A0A7W9AGK2_9SPHN|nr:methyl-accepting chemotaxis protein [Sphingobium boeckii]MBB5685244.1 methyl-accepting chemotaxis protein [Sphingobium boeckii]